MSRSSSFFKHISATIVPSDSHDNVAPSWRRRRPSLGNCSPSASSSKRFPRLSLGSCSPSVSSGKRFSKVLSKARRVLTPGVNPSPMACSSSPCAWRRLGEFPCSPKAWFSPRKSPKKSPRKYIRRRSSVEIDHELEELLCSHELGQDALPGSVSQNDGFFGFFSSDFCDFSARDSSIVAGRRGSRLAQDVGRSNNTKKDNHNLSLEEALAREEEDSIRLSHITNSSIAQLELHDSLSNPASFGRNRDRLCEKVRKLEALQQQLADPTQFR